MSLKDKLSALLPFNKKEEVIEYFFALNIGNEKLTASLWVVEDKELKILETASGDYSSQGEIIEVTDRLLDGVMGIREVEIAKILFGVPNSWLLDDNLKEDYLKLLRDLVKELELSPLAYVSTSNAIIHLVEKQEGVPTTAILVGFEPHHLTVTVVRAGKLDGVKIVTRGDSSGTDIEKALLTFVSVETLPSKILIYGLEQDELTRLKNQLLSFPWMSNLSFLHLPKIDVLGEDIEIKGVCLAGATELDNTVFYKEIPINKSESKPKISGEKDQKEIGPQETADADKDFGFVVGDVSEQLVKKEDKVPLGEEEVAAEDKREAGEIGNVVPVSTSAQEVDDFEKEMPFATRLAFLQKWRKRIGFTYLTIIGGIIAALIILSAGILLLPKAEVKVFVEPRVLEKDAQVIADPGQKEVNEEEKIIPGQVVETEVSGSANDSATGKRQVGDPAKGTVILYNKTENAVNISKGTVLTGPGSTKFALDLSVSIASSEARTDGISFGKTNATVTAQAVGADGNIPSDSDLSVAGFSSNQVTANAEGNFAGGTSKEVTVVSDADQKRLLATLASDLRRQAQQKLQEKYPDKKILEEALAEEIVRRSYSKNVNDQASEFSLNLTINYSGTAFEEQDLRLIVSKLVDTQVEEGFELDLNETETQADVSKLEKDGRLIFLARFRAKLLPKIDTEKIKKQIRGKTPTEVDAILKRMENILGSEVILRPNLPPFLQRIPILTQNITVEVGLK